MTRDEYPRLVKDIEAEHARLRDEQSGTRNLKGSGGDGTSGSMEARVARLEADVDYIKRDVVDIKADVRLMRNDMAGLKVDVARLDERIKVLPSKGFIVSAAVTIIGLLTAIIVLAEKIRVVVGMSH